MRAFAGLELGRDVIPDETTILNFRHLLERHELTKAVCKHARKAAETLLSSADRRVDHAARAAAG
jgi:IS5 family transposase